MAAGVDVVVKHENVQPTGAFKVRGGVAIQHGDPARAGCRTPGICRLGGS